MISITFQITQKQIPIAPFLQISNIDKKQVRDKREVSRSGDISWAVSSTKVQIHLFKPQTRALFTKHCVQGSLNYKAEYNQPDFPKSGL